MNYPVLFPEPFKNSISLHEKDGASMVAWLNQTAQMLLDSGCTEQSCLGANATLLRETLIEH